MTQLLRVLSLMWESWVEFLLLSLARVVPQCRRHLGSETVHENSPLSLCSLSLNFQQGKYLNFLQHPYVYTCKCVYVSMNAFPYILFVWRTRLIGMAKGKTLLENWKLFCFKQLNYSCKSVHCLKRIDIISIARNRDSPDSERTRGSAYSFHMHFVHMFSYFPFLDSVLNFEQEIKNSI